MTSHRLLLCVVPLLGLVACAANDVTAAGFDAPSRGEAGDGGSSGGGNGGSAADPGVPAEQEVESTYQAPVATGRYVWIANPTSGRIAFVDATSLAVRTVEAGNGPTYLAGVPGQTEDTTVVLNVLSQDATLLRATAQNIERRSFKVAPQANSLAFSADGHFAIAWADARKVTRPPKTEGFQDLTVLDLAAGTSTVLAVGYRPVTVGFAADAPRAYAVTQDGIALVDLSAAPRVTKNVAISASASEDPVSRDVSVTPDGKVALIRRDNSPIITVVSLDSDKLATVTLPGAATALHLTDAGDRAVAVVRETSQAVILPVPQILDAPTAFSTVTITGETVGSAVITPGGDKALLYTSAFATEHLTILDLSAAPATFRTVRLYSPLLAVFSAPDAAHALVLHDKTAASGSTPGTPGAFSLVPIATALPAKIVATRAPPTAVAVTNEYAVVAERDDATRVYGAYLARMPALMVERYPLASPPIASGIVPSANRAFVAQQHPDGRLTFIDLDTGVARTLTGFELSSRVVDGSTP
jgi:hypothetical protein